MMRPLSTREKWLAGIVGGTVFLCLNAILIESAWSSYQRLNSDLHRKAKQLRLAEQMSADLDFWAQREQWLQATQPHLENSDSAGVQLLNRVTEIAKKQSVLLENPALRPPERQPNYESVAVDVETKSPWKPLVSFLRELQQPDQFVALENANLKIDPNDPTQMRGRFKIARWYAPK